MGIHSSVCRPRLYADLRFATVAFEPGRGGVALQLLTQTFHFVTLLTTRIFFVLYHHSQILRNHS